MPPPPRPSPDPRDVRNERLAACLATGHGDPRQILLAWVKEEKKWLNSLPKKRSHRSRVSRAAPAVVARPDLSEVRTVGLSASARRVILETARADRAWEFETGGALVGYVVGGDAVVIVDATGRDPGVKLERGKFTPGPIRGLALEEAHRGRGSSACWLGDWHTHSRDNGSPSEPDHQHWLERAQISGFDWLSLIVTPLTDWRMEEAKLIFSAYATRPKPGSGGERLCRQLTVGEIVGEIE
jgi:integrative and conjugative element protein (TIGR02256 family)